MLCPARRCIRVRSMPPELDEGFAPSLSESVEALRRPLSFAARDNFAGIDRVTNLGGTLAGACARLGTLLAGERATALQKWGRDLHGFDARPRGERERLVARGMRL